MVDLIPLPMENRHDEHVEEEEATFESAFGERFEAALDIQRWTAEDHLEAAYERMDWEVAAAVLEEDRYRQRIREELFTPEFFRQMQTQQGLRIIGKYRAALEDLQRVHRGLLFNGGVEACDGLHVVHDTLPLTITQIGVCLVSYGGTQNQYSHRLYRRDLRSTPEHPMEEIRALLEQRRQREAQGVEGGGLSELARRSVMTYAERAILARKATAPWRLGHGSPAPYELLTNFWTSPARLPLSLELIRWYVLDHQRFVFVPSAPRDRHLITLGNALEPLEYLILGTLKPDIEALIAAGGYRQRSGVLPAMQDFAQEVASKIVVGLYRVWKGAPPYLFYAHVDHADTAAHIVMADSLLQEHRGFPLLIDLADAFCKAAFAGEGFSAAVQNAYADAGQPYRYLGERETRYR